MGLKTKIIMHRDNLHHFIVHMDPACKWSTSVKEGIQHLLQHSIQTTELLATNKQSIFSHHYPIFQSRDDMAEYSSIMETILNNERLIFSGGYFENCLRSQLLFMTLIRMRHGLQTEIHLPLQSIFKNGFFKLY